MVENTESHQIIEEFMLAANEAVADTLHEAGVPFLRRVHANPDPRKLHALTEFVAELGFQTSSLENRFELQKLLGSIHGRPEEHAVNYAVLRSLQRAVYSAEEEGHYALASKCYCHFTSPIRRYPDLTIHRLVAALVAKQKPPSDMGVLVTAGEHCSEREQRAEGAERELTKLKLLLYMSSHLGEQMDAVVTGVEEFGLFVQGTKLPAEGSGTRDDAGGRLLSVRPAEPYADGESLGECLSARRYGARGSGARGYRPARTGFPRCAAQGAAAYGEAEPRQGETFAQFESRCKEGAEEARQAKPAGWEAREATTVIILPILNEFYNDELFYESKHTLHCCSFNFIPLSM